MSDTFIRWWLGFLTSAALALMWRVFNPTFMPTAMEIYAGVNAVCAMIMWTIATWRSR